MISKDILDSYEATIGIECHVQLKTKTKLFSCADNDARDKEPNTAIEFVDFAFPGVLPVLNEQAVQLAVKAGLALNSEIARMSRFERKHYFYPDLPKGYQITQLAEPIIGPGVVNAPLPNGETVKVRIHHAHMEEDAGKLTHHGDYSLVDLNRAGTPLIEIVSEADMHSPEEAKAFAQELYLLMTYAGVTNGDLYHGNMRFDVNLSVAKKGAREWGTRTETKNLNSFKSVERSAEYEFKRQIEVLEKGEKVVQETRGWDDAKQKTFSQRSKEDAPEYRYFPDADIPPVELTDEEIETTRRSMPVMPGEIRMTLEDKGIPRNDVETLLNYPLLRERVWENLEIASAKELKQVSNLLINLMPGEFEADQNINLNLPNRYLNSENLLKLVRMVNDKKISSSAAKGILAAHWTQLRDPEMLAEEMNLLQVSNEDEIMAIVDAVLAEPAAQKAVDDIKAGNDKVIGFLVGQVMKQSKGKANPALAQTLIRRRIES